MGICAAKDAPTNEAIEVSSNDRTVHQSSSGSATLASTQGLATFRATERKVTSFAARFRRYYHHQALKLLLQDEVGRKAFQEYLTSQYSQENMLFYLEMEKHRDVKLDPQEEKARAQAIYNKYIRVGGSFEVNIAADIREHVDSAVSMETLFEAQEAIFKLMSLSCFPKFLDSPYFQEYEEALLEKCSDIACSEDSWIAYFASTCESLPVCICISDMTSHDNPVVYVNPFFEKMTGYSKQEVVGRNCRFLQGPKTDPKAVALLHDAIHGATPINIAILNYKKDGTEFINLLHMKPIKNRSGNLVYFIGVQFNISEAHQSERVVRDLVYLDPVVSLLPDVVDWE